MIDISFELDGKKIDPNNIADAFETAVLNSITESIKDIVNSVHCDKHNEKIEIVVIGKDIDNLSMKISGCCDDYIEKVQNSFN
ncbi:hypothetical protein ACMC56_01265 [Campylobacterota bacterium DY0563]